MGDREKYPGSEEIVRCSKCIHYYITYDPKRPYGCRAMGFKSKISPAQVVYSNSGIICQLYMQKTESGNSAEVRDRYSGNLNGEGS